MAEENKQNKFKLKIPEDVESGIYSNAISVHMNNNECIIDFAYTIPNNAEPTIKVLSRVNMSHKTAESFLNILSNALLDWRNKGKQEKNNPNQ